MGFEPRQHPFGLETVNEFTEHIKVAVKEAKCYESPKQENVSHTFEHLIQNLKAYNGVRI